MRVSTGYRTAASVAALLAIVLAFAGSALAASLPTISKFTPTKAAAAAKVTIDGKNFKGTQAVMVDGVKMKFKVLSPTKIVATLSTKAKTGKITVATPAGKATSLMSLKVS
jgi:hypothetical protein